MSAPAIAPEKIDRVSSPVLRALLKEKVDAARSSYVASESKPSVYDYDKYTHEKSSECLCVIGGM